MQADVDAAHPARPEGPTPPTLCAMAMGNRPEVETAQAPIAALDVALLAQQLGAALLRVPFRRPMHQDGSNPAANLGICVTREVIRTFMGYTSSLPIPEFRSVELVLDDICKVIMPPVVRSLDVKGHPAQLGGVPGIFYRPRQREPIGVILYLHGGGYIGTSPQMYAFFTSRVCRETDCAVFVADYRLAPEFPYPAGEEDATAAYEALRDLGVPNERLFLAGDSGGGGLANSVLLSRPEHLAAIRPAGLILFSPEVDLRLDEPSVTENAHLDILPWNIPTASYLHGEDASKRVDLAARRQSSTGSRPPSWPGAATRCSATPSAATPTAWPPPACPPTPTSSRACSTSSRSSCPGPRRATSPSPTSGPSYRSRWPAPRPSTPVSCATCRRRARLAAADLDFPPLP